MTNEFAIKVLTELKGYGDKFANIGFDRKEALDLAIKALEQQPCEDCISREDVKEMLMEEWTKYIPMELDINLSFVLEKISELPSVTPKARWIPVSEKLPEEGGTYLITTKIEIHDLKPYYEVRTAKFDGKYFDIGYIGDGFNVIAWMPLQEPYKED